MRRSSSRAEYGPLRRIFIERLEHEPVEGGVDRGVEVAGRLDEARALDAAAGEQPVDERTQRVDIRSTGRASRRA